MAKYIKVDGSITDVYPASGGQFSLKELQILVGGYIEIVRTKNPDIILVVDEEGRLKNKDINRTATHMYLLAGGFDVVVGDVVVAAYPQEVD